MADNQQTTLKERCKIEAGNLTVAPSMDFFRNATQEEFEEVMTNFLFSFANSVLNDNSLKEKELGDFYNSIGLFISQIGNDVLREDLEDALTRFGSIEVTS